MIKSRLEKIEKRLLPKEPSYITCTQYFVDGTVEYEGKKYANELEFETAIGGKKVVYLMNYRDDSSPKPHSAVD
jgi:hypothetical protein